MTLAVVSDIHGNLTALEAVITDLERRGIDRVIHGGDLATGGCQPAEVIDRIRELGWPGVLGNVDQLLWRPTEYEHQLQRAPKLRALLELLFQVYAPATLELIGHARLGWLRSLASEHREPSVLVLHASPGNLWWAPMPDDDDERLISTYERCGTPSVVYGHIHRPYVRRLPNLVVANAGSVGSPFDGDPRASYAVVEDDKISVVRVEYDVEREVSLLQRSAYPDASRIAESRRHGRFLPIATIGNSV